MGLPHTSVSFPSGEAEAGEWHTVECDNERRAHTHEEKRNCSYPFHGFSDIKVMLQ